MSIRTVREEMIVIGQKTVCQKLVKLVKKMIVRGRSYRTKHRYQNLVKKKMVCQILVVSVRKMGIIRQIL